LVEDVRVVLIKMADRLHNMRTIGAMPPHKQLKVAAETSYIYAPLAHRLGLYAIKNEFEDLCLKVTNPDIYFEIARKLKDTRKGRNAYIETFIKPLKKSLDEVGFPYRIYGRPKSIFSIWNKIKSKQVPFEQIYDLFAIRIVIDVDKHLEKRNCWVVYSIVTDHFHPIPARLKDWVTTPKSNGYESLHTTVVGPEGRYVEVQIRSERMEDIAERGFAAHWKYKGNSNQPNVYEVWLDSVREIMENKEADAIEFLDDFKTNLFQEEVYVFTPMGDMKALPKGATALDFAFSIHTDIGYHCKSIFINNKLVPMGQTLENGDQITVNTAKNQKPNENWLRMVVTGKARSKIRSALKEEQQRQGELGKEALQRKLRSLKADFEENVDMLVRHYGFNSRNDLYYAISTEQVHLLDLKKFKVEGHKLVDPFANRKPVSQAPPNQGEKGSRAEKWQPRLLINGQPAEQFNYTLANCCNPVQGDKVFAFISTSGAKIHRISCPNATHLVANYSYRVMKAEWVNTPGSTSFIAHLRITGVDDGPGVIERLSQKISTSLGLNIRAFYIDGNEGYFEGKISLIVTNKDQLYQAIQGLRGLHGISSVIRVEDEND
jgi:guanosine-3',5'-bis(diphosphate) 3'-pyrophosphohydrolase